MYQNDAMKVLTGEVRLSYAYLSPLTQGRELKQVDIGHPLKDNLVAPHAGA